MLGAGEAHERDGVDRAVRLTHATPSPGTERTGGLACTYRHRSCTREPSPSRAARPPASGTPAAAPAPRPSPGPAAAAGSAASSARVLDDSRKSPSRPAGPRARGTATARRTTRPSRTGRPRTSRRLERVASHWPACLCPSRFGCSGLSVDGRAVATSTPAARPAAYLPAHSRPTSGSAASPAATGSSAAAANRHPSSTSSTVCRSDTYPTRDREVDQQRDVEPGEDEQHPQPRLRPRTAAAARPRPNSASAPRRSAGSSRSPRPPPARPTTARPGWPSIGGLLHSANSGPPTTGFDRLRPASTIFAAGCRRGLQDDRDGRLVRHFPISTMYGTATSATPTARAVEPAEGEVARPAAGERRATTATAPAAAADQQPLRADEVARPGRQPAQQERRRRPGLPHRPHRRASTATAAASRYTPSVRPSLVIRAGTGNTWNSSAAANPTFRPNSIRPIRYVGTTSSSGGRGVGELSGEQACCRAAGRSGGVTDDLRRHPHREPDTRGAVRRPG